VHNNNTFRRLGLFLDFLFCFIGLHVYFFISKILFFLRWVYNIVWNQALWSIQTLLFLIRITFVIQGLLYFQIHCRNAFSNSMKSNIIILIVISLNLYIDFGKIDISIISFLPVHEHKRSFYHLVPSISFFKML
jgi:hypothetical protein